jgi:hypothetical protein
MYSSILIVFNYYNKKRRKEGGVWGVGQSQNKKFFFSIW